MHEKSEPPIGTHPYKETLEQKINAAFAPVYLFVGDETWKHAGHAGVLSGGGHFSVHLVSPQFEEVPLLTRHRMVFALFKNEMGSAIHALSIRAQTVAEWERTHEGGRGSQ